jgi:hypothetical protein
MMMILGGVICLSVSGFIFMFLFKRQTSQSDGEF